MAACLIEVADETGSRALLRQEIYRTAAEAKARKLSSVMVAITNLIDDNMRLYPIALAQQRDLLQNGLITEKEMDEAIAETPEESIASAAEDLRPYPNCRLLERMNSPAARAIKAQAGQ